MQTLGVPYEEGYDNKAIADMQQQADEITATLANEKIEVSRDKEIIALIAYLQRIGTDIKLEQKTAQN